MIIRARMDVEDPGGSTARYARFMEDSCCTQFCTGPNPGMARYVYGLIFLVTSLLAWTIRDYGHTALSELQRLKGCHGARYCLGAEGVLRISLGGFTFFFVMFLSTAGTQKRMDSRNSWHSEWWPAKIIIWLGLLAIPFLVPSPFIQLYGKVAHFGAGVFLIIQLFSIISFITWLNDCCRSDKYVERCRIHAHVISASAYAAAILGVVFMYVLYAPESGCSRNIFFISVTLLLIPTITFVSLHSKVQAGLLAPSLMSAYIVFLCWCAIRSEPQSAGACDRFRTAAGSDWLTIMSFVIAVIVIVMATFSTGIDSKSFQFKKAAAAATVVPEEDVPYGYGFFHLVFAMGTMYFAMLFVGWNSHRTMQRWTIDVGWASTWVRIVNEWLATIVYVWMLVAPLVWKTNRVESSNNNSSSRMEESSIDTTAVAAAAAAAATMTDQYVVGIVYDASPPYETRRFGCIL